MGVKNETKKIPFLPELNYFRGIAIFCIVYGHILTWAGSHTQAVERYAPWHAYQTFLVNGGTSIFVFISGFLFYYLFYRRGFNYKQFLLSKAKNVLSPYLVFCALLAVCKGTTYPDHFGSAFWIHEVFVWYAFWYIPFILFVFICSPLYIRFIELKPKMAWGVFAISVLYSCTSGRHNGNPILSALFWSVFYLLGIQCAIYYKKLQKLTAMDKWSLVLSFICMLTWILALNFQNQMFRDLPAWEFRFIAHFIVLPKICYCVVILFFCQYLASSKWGKFIKQGLEVLAKYSFTIFFMHTLVMYYVFTHETLLVPFVQIHKGHPIPFSLFLASGGICAGCALVGWIGTKIFGKYSRPLLGA